MASKMAQLISKDKAQEMFSDSMLKTMVVTAVESVRMIEKDGATEFNPVLIGMGLDPEGDIQKFIAQIKVIDDTRYEMFERMGSDIFNDTLVLPVAIVFVCEGWTVRLSPEEAKRRREEGFDKFPLPSQDPNRVEILSITGETLDGRMATAFFDIKRDIDNQIILVENTPPTFAKEGDCEAPLLDRFFDGAAMAVFRHVAGFMQEELKKKVQVKPVEAKPGPKDFWAPDRTGGRRM